MMGTAESGEGHDYKQLSNSHVTFSVVDLKISISAAK